VEVDVPDTEDQEAVEAKQEGTTGRAASAAQHSDEERQLAERLKQDREYVGLSQDQVAKALGIPRAAVSAIETGRRKVSSLELARLAALFGTSPDRLLGASLAEDPTAVQLFRATKTLSEGDRVQVLRFAEFLRNAGTPPKVDITPEEEQG
jgi:transcriptional regulator with XRE-family HTH domain